MDFDNLKNWKETCLRKNNGYGMCDDDAMYNAILEYENEVIMIDSINQKFNLDENSVINNQIFDKIYEFLKEECKKNKISVISAKNILNEYNSKIKNEVNSL